VSLEPLPLSPSAERAVQKALAGISTDIWIESMMKVVDLYPSPTSWTAATGEQILSELLRYREMARYIPVMDIFDMSYATRVVPMREAYAEQLLRDTLNSTPFRFKAIV
jgi:hypothetical protein